MKLFLRIFLSFLFIFPLLANAENHNLLTLDVEGESNASSDLDCNVTTAYGEPQCDDDEYDDDAPVNRFKTVYENARMAFLFGQAKVAYKAWLPLAEQGYAKAQASLGWMYYTGKGVKKDLKKAVKWFRLAAEQDHAIAQNNLAVMYENGYGVAIDYQEAFKWYKKSADSGYSYAQYNLGRMYAEGKGIRKNLNEAKYWWLSASQHKVKQATEALAKLENMPVPESNDQEPKKVLAHAPYHSNPATKGLAWVKVQSPDNYTIQLSRSQDIDWILKLAASARLPQPIIQFNSINTRGDVWYNLIYGSFSSKREAEFARKRLPETLQKWSPKLVKFSEVQQLLNK
jgi:hypothetical protein